METEKKTAFLLDRARLYDRTLRDHVQYQKVTELTSPLADPTVEWYDSYGDPHYQELNTEFMNGHAAVMSSLRKDLHAFGEEGMKMAQDIEMDIQIEYKL